MDASERLQHLITKQLILNPVDCCTISPAHYSTSSFIAATAIISAVVKVKTFVFPFSSHDAKATLFTQCESERDQI